MSEETTDKRPPTEQRPICLKELRNCILCIIRVWSLFCSVRVDISLHFLPIPLLKLGFNLSEFWSIVFLYLLFLVFSFSVLCFQGNILDVLSSMLPQKI